MHNLLTDPLIRTNLPEALSLPALYAALMRDEVSLYPALRPHQDAPWHMFLAQLGALAMRQAGRTEPPEDADSWREMIRALTPSFESDEPWCLIGEDRSKPAFMQPPEPEDGATYTGQAETPDALDMLVTSKNHDLKQAIVKGSGLDDWIYALVTRQTGEGYGGSGNYGISRMNGSGSSRVSLSLVHMDNPEIVAVSPGKRLVWDTRKLLRDRERLLENCNFYPQSGGLSLLWISPWPEGEKLPMDRLDPWFIEISRRIRIVVNNGSIAALTGTSKGERIEAKALKGNTGDPWSAVNQDSGCLKLKSGEFSYSRLDQILFGQWSLPPMLNLTKFEKGMGAYWLLIAQGISKWAEGPKSVTEGYRERRLILPRKFASILSVRDERAALGNISKAQIEDIGRFHKCLKIAIGLFERGGAEIHHLPNEQQRKAKEKQTKTYQEYYQTRLDKAADTLFFPALWKRYEAKQEDDDFESEDAARLDFLKDMLKTSEKLLDEALASLPCPAIYRHRAHVRANAKFHGMITSEKHGFPALRNQPKQEEGQQDDAA